MKVLVLASVSLALMAPLQAQWLNYPTPGIPRTADGKPNVAAPAPRTPEGKPDLTGVWNRVSPKYGANIAADLKPEDIQPWAEALVEQRKENLGRDHMTVHCLPLGPGYSTAQRYVKIVQTPTLIVMLDEDLTYRQIYLDGRPLEKDPQPTWMGYSVGHWEGDTLVVESSGFNDKTWLDTDGHPHSEALHTTERYRRPDFGHLEMESTIQDPKVYAKPFKVTISSLLAPDNELLEAVCNENNKNLEHWVGKASDDVKSEVNVAPETLAKYAGTYVEQPKLWRTVARTIVITSDGNALFGDLDGRGKVQLHPTSASNFVGIQGGVEFVVKDPPTAPTDLFVKHVSGNYRFARTR
ncbi:MAG: hypothetical protein M3O20_09440 [Acidobacteriota bacterium]|nr:hypothetical protein [Acidobacteriota bacterium]